jgi:hypothetical protein
VPVDATTDTLAALPTPERSSDPTPTRVELSALGEVFDANGNKVGQVGEQGALLPVRGEVSIGDGRLCLGVALVKPSDIVPELGLDSMAVIVPNRPLPESLSSEMMADDGLGEGLSPPDSDDAARPDAPVLPQAYQLPVCTGTSGVLVRSDLPGLPWVEAETLDLRRQVAPIPPGGRGSLTKAVTCEVDAAIDARGRAVAVDPWGCSETFRIMAEAAVWRWRWRRDDEAEPVRTRLTVAFEPR